MAASLDSLAAALGRARTLGLAPVDAADAAVLVRELACLGRQVDALRVGLLDEIEALVEPGLRDL